MLYKMTCVGFTTDLFDEIQERSITESDVYLDVNKIESLYPNDWRINGTNRVLPLTTIIMASGKKHRVKESPEEILKRMLNQNVW